MKKHIDLSEKQKKIIYVISILIFILLFLFITIIIGKHLVNYAKEPERFKEWINSYGIFSRFVFILIVALQVVVAIIPG